MNTNRNPTIQIGDQVKLNVTGNARVETVIDIWDTTVTTDRGIRHITKIIKIHQTTTHEE